MLGGSMDFYGQMPSAYDWASFEFLAHENYSSWKIFMHKLLYSYGQEHLDIVLGKHTRLDAEDKDNFDAVDEIIRLAIDKEIHPWVLDVFSSSKELWDSLQFKFEIDAVMADMRGDTEIVQEGVLGTLCHDDYKTEEEHAAWIKREQSDMFFIVKDNMNLLKSYDVSHFSQEFQLCEAKSEEFDACHIVDNASQDIIQQLEVPFIDDNLEVAAKVRLENKPWKLAASDALTSLCLLEDHVQQGQNNSYMETVAPTDLEQDQDVIVESEQDDLHVACLHEHRDEIFEHQVYTADLKDEFVLQLPWMDIYEQTLISEVCKGTGGAHAGAMHDCFKFSSAKILAEQFHFFEFKHSSKGVHFSVASQDKCREWYRGRKIWFKTNISRQAWLLLWLTLLHMLNSSTGVLSLQQCLSSGGMIFPFC